MYHLPSDLLSAEACAKRYPRLMRAAKWAACLSETEASCALRDVRHVRLGLLPAEYLRHGGGEAVSHFGGPQAVITAAIHARHVTRIDMNRLRGMARLCAHTWERGGSAYRDLQVYDANSVSIGMIEDREWNAFQRALADVGKVNRGYHFPDLTTGCTTFYV